MLCARRAVLANAEVRMRIVMLEMARRQNRFRKKKRRFSAAEFSFPTFRALFDWSRDGSCAGSPRSGSSLLRTSEGERGVVLI